MAPAPFLLHGSPSAQGHSRPVLAAGLTRQAPEPRLSPCWASPAQAAAGPEAALWPPMRGDRGRAGEKPREMADEAPSARGKRPAVRRSRV